MAITTTNPVIKDGNTYDKLSVSLALSSLTVLREQRLSIAVRLTPYRTTEQGVERLEGDARALVYGDAAKEAENDPALAEFLRVLEVAGQAFIKAKGL